jgi:hypothetical protein
MVLDILSHTPAWVWALLVALLALGFAQTRARELSLGRVTVLPAILATLSLLGAASGFGLSPVALGAWVAGFFLAYRYAGALVRVRGASWSAQSARLHVPGSWVPLFLIVGLFLLKYAVGVTLAMRHTLALDPLFAGACSLAYGAFAGLFWRRAQSLRVLARGDQHLGAARTA